MKHRQNRLWNLCKALYRRTIRLRTRFPLIPALFTPKEMMLNDAMAFVAHCRVPGDYLEFGTYEGNAFIAAYHFSKTHEAGPMRYWAFDSFRGLPEPKGADAGPEFSGGDFACDERAFRKNLKSGGVRLEEVTVVPGYYEASLKEKRGVSGAAVVLVDCDLYESAAKALEFVTDLVADGTVLIFDDWFHFKGDPDRGEQRAFREWLDRNPGIRASRYRAYSWHGLSYILHRGEAARAR